MPQDPDSLTPKDDRWPNMRGTDQVIGSGSEENREPPLGGGEPVDNQHRKIAGYRDFDQATVDRINDVKSLEQVTADLARHVQDEGGTQHDIDAAKLHLRQGFMLLIRAIAKPKDPWA